MMYAELISRSYFSLLDGGSSPEELFQAASAAGVSHLALADRDCVYGLVRAHRAAKECGVALINAASMTIREHPSLVLLVENQQGWRNLCRLITASRADQEKGKGALMKEQLLASAEGLSCLLRPGWTLEQARPLREAFEERLALARSRSLSPRDKFHQDWADNLSQQLGAKIVATNDVICHAPERQAVADVLNCIRRRTTLERVGRQLRPNAERCILELQDFKNRYQAHPYAFEEASRFASRCEFSLDELRYNYPRELVPEGWTSIGWLRHLCDLGLQTRYPECPPDAVKKQVEYELRVIEELHFSAYFLTVYDIVRFARSRSILCQGRGSAANSAVCYVLGITSVDPAHSSLLFERFISKERGEPPDIDVDFEHERREE